MDQCTLDGRVVQRPRLDARDIGRRFVQRQLLHRPHAIPADGRQQIEGLPAGRLELLLHPAPDRLAVRQQVVETRR
jgi:hypothetical protein